MDVIFDIIATEEKRQREGLELIPSENYVSRDVLAAMGSVLTNKYSEVIRILMGLRLMMRRQYLRAISR